MRVLRGAGVVWGKGGGLEKTLLKVECCLGTLPPCRMQFCCVRRGFWWLLVTDCLASQAGRSGRSARCGFRLPLWFRFEHDAGYPTDAGRKKFLMWQGSADLRLQGAAAFASVLGLMYLAPKLIQLSRRLPHRA